jgi:broad specificity phosphatase PhoE
MENEFSKTPYSLATLHRNKPVLLILRHGATGDDDTYNSPVNPPLDDEGKKQVSETADFLKQFEPDKIIASPTHRSKESADIVGKKLGKEVQVNKDIDSLDVGDVKDIKSNEEADRVIKHHQQNIHEPLPGGESVHHFQERVRPVLMDSIHSYHETGKPDIISAHHSVQHEAGQFFNGNKDSALTEPGGVVGVFQTPQGLRAKAIYKASDR